MSTLTARNVPMAQNSDPADIAVRVNALATVEDSRPGVSTLTTTQRNALTGAEVWDGRVILNTTTDRLNRYDLGTTQWVPVADFSEIAALLATTDTPADLAIVASRGVSSSASRADHIHAWPAWQNWTPALNAGAGTIGNGTTTGRYVQLGKTLHFWGKLTVGTTTSFLGVQVWTLPVAATGAISYSSAQAHFHDVSSATGYDATARLTSPVSLSVYGRAVVNGQVTATYPFPFSVGDTIEFLGTYEAA